jgi:hypothetical protein
MYLILSKQDLERRGTDSKEPTSSGFEHTLKVIELGSLKVRRVTDIRPGENIFPDKPPEWKDEDIIFLSTTYSDVKTIGGIVMHEEEAKVLAEYILATYKSKEHTNDFIQSIVPWRTGDSADTEVSDKKYLESGYRTNIKEYREFQEKQVSYKTKKRFFW